MYSNKSLFCPTEWAECDNEGSEYETSWNPETGEWIFAYSMNLMHPLANHNFEEYVAPLIVEQFIKYELYIESTGISDITDTMNKRLSEMG